MNYLPKGNLPSKSLLTHGQLINMLLAILLSFISVSSNANEFDQRQALQLNEKQKAHVLTEMRNMLAGIQAIVAALAADDLQAVALHARPLGMSMKQKPEDTLHSVLPKAFKMMGKAVHQDFDRIADDAEQIKDPKHTLRQLSVALNRCQGCHESFRISVASTVLGGQKSNK